MDKLGSPTPEPTDTPDEVGRSQVFDAVIATLAAFPKPLLIAVNGLAVGFGATILG